MINCGSESFRNLAIRAQQSPTSVAVSVAYRRFWYTFDMTYATPFWWRIRANRFPNARLNVVA